MIRPIRDPLSFGSILADGPQHALLILPYSVDGSLEQPTAP